MLYVQITASNMEKLLGMQQHKRVFSRIEYIQRLISSTRRERYVLVQLSWQPRASSWKRVRIPVLLPLLFLPVYCVLAWFGAWLYTACDNHCAHSWLYHKKFDEAGILYEYDEWAKPTLSTADALLSTDSAVSIWAATTAIPATC